MVLRAYLFLVLTALAWGGNAIAGKLAVGHISPMMLTSLRWAVAFVIMLPFGFRHIARERALIRANLPLLFAYGALGFTCFNVLLYSALHHTTAINVVIEQAGMPMVIFLANFLIFRIRATGAQMLGFLLTVAGVILTASGGSLSRLLALDLNVGDALMLAAVVLYGGYSVALRYKPAISWQSMITVLSGAALITSLPFTAWEIGYGDVIWPDLRGWELVLFAALFPSLVSQVLFIRANDMIGSNRAGLFMNLVPIFGTLMSVLILGEALHIYHVLALTLVIGGIWLAERGKRAEQPRN
ncbi:drug/metabolite transporter (DMT)-like permease [Hoeflea marina]|uniref:Drug/metabolite transporter (DMT)-like permease n=1 Tax=Hoeflea marina TaxID=274592 RepID=A0A317PGB5_9HYPH|nr:DMT family transporter [Hoeflea marina]PWV95527.1 drug/metabolite transporter (DMT)-like permease [Hoeflea marina]